MKKAFTFSILFSLALISYSQKPNLKAGPFNQYQTAAIFHTKAFDKVDWECLVVCKTAAGAFAFYYLMEKNPLVSAPLTIVSQTLNGTSGYFYVKFSKNGDTFLLHLDGNKDMINMQKTSGNLSQPYNQNYYPDGTFN